MGWWLAKAKRWQRWVPALAIAVVVLIGAGLAYASSSGDDPAPAPSICEWSPTVVDSFVRMAGDVRAERAEVAEHCPERLAIWTAAG